jgi:hypothetical protein
MQITLSGAAEATRDSDRIRSEIDSALRRFNHRIRHVGVHFTSNQTGTNSPEAHCAVEVRLMPRGSLYVSADGATMSAALSSAIARARTVVAKTVDATNSGHELRHSGRASPLEFVLDDVPPPIS